MTSKEALEYIVVDLTSKAKEHDKEEIEQLEKDLDFTLEAKAQALILPTGKQAGFGLMARDEMYIDTKVSSMNGSYVACGGLKPNDSE